MKVGVAIEEDTWAYFKEIHAELKAHHEVDLFQRRVVNPPFFIERTNRALFRHDLTRFLERNDVIFFEWASHLLVTASQFPKRAAIVSRLHRYEMYQWVDEVNWDHVDRLILVSEAKCREFADRFPDHAHKAVVIPESISLSRFEAKPRAFSGNIGILCHLRPRKRVYELILAFADLLEVSDDFHLTIGGGMAADAPEYPHVLRTLVAKLGLQEKVTFSGHVSNPEAWLRNVDIFISNSYSEGLQVAPMEAIASGCFCLSHDWDGADELLPMEHLYHTDRQLNAQILRYAEAPEAERQRERERQREIVYKRFDVEKIKGQIRDVVEEAGSG